MKKINKNENQPWYITLKIKKEKIELSTPLDNKYACLKEPSGIPEKKL